MKREIKPLMNTEAETRAVTEAYLADRHANAAITHAVRCGLALNEAKKGYNAAQIQAGEWKEWISNNMPVSLRQCRKWQQLAKQKPELGGSYLEGVHCNHLDINSEILLLAFSDVEQVAIRNMAEEESMTQKQLAETMKNLKAVNAKLSTAHDQVEKEQDRADAAIKKSNELRKALEQLAKNPPIDPTTAEKLKLAETAAVADKRYVQRLKRDLERAETAVEVLKNAQTTLMLDMDDLTAQTTPKEVKELKKSMIRKQNEIEEVSHKLKSAEVELRVSYLMGQRELLITQINAIDSELWALKSREEK
jgi:hypothetical protein